MAIAKALGGPLAVVAGIALLTAAIKMAAVKSATSTAGPVAETAEDPIPPGYTRYVIQEQQPSSRRDRPTSTSHQLRASDTSVRSRHRRTRPGDPQA